MRVRGPGARCASAGPTRRRDWLESYAAARRRAELRAIADLTAAGWSPWEIGEVLVRSEATVRRRLEEIAATAPARNAEPAPPAGISPDAGA